MAMSTRATRSSRKAPSKSPVKSQLIHPKCDEEESESDTDLDALVSTAVDGVRQKYGHEDTNFSGLGLGFVIDKTPGANNILEDTKSDEDETDSESEEETSVKKSSDTSSNKSNRRQKGKNESIKLASSLQSGLDFRDLYTNSDSLKKPRHSNQQRQLMVSQSHSEKEVMKKSVLTPGIEKEHSLPPYQESKRQLKKQSKAKRESTKGKNWFDLAATEVTEEMKNDLSILKMRRVLDPKRFYKGNDMKGLPKFFQMGRIVEDATDFYSARIPKKLRKNTMLEELMADSEFRKYNKRKYNEIQEATVNRHRGAYKRQKRLKKNKR